MKIAIPDNTPILIGVGQVSERIGQDGYRRRSPADLMADAARAAADDALPGAGLAAKVDAIFAIRTVGDSVPAPMRPQRAPFGGPDNMPGAVAARLAAKPSTQVYSPACGDEPQLLAGEACERLHAGELSLVLLCGAEAASTQKAAVSAGEKLDWRESHPGPLEDRNWNAGALRTRHMNDHQMILPTTVYPMLENALRARLRLGRSAYALEMGRLIAPFTEVAAANPHAASRKVWSAEDIAAISADNRLIADPHPVSVVARDQVNQGAAVLLTTVGNARALGIPESRWVYLYGYAAAKERHVLERQDLSRSEAMAGAYAQALGAADVTIDQIRYLDIYSCFPIAVFAALDALNLRTDDKRGFTLTGGLAHFGGPGNNYSMHAIAELVQRLRSDPGSLGLIGANGGFLSTHAVGIYSTTPRAFKTCDSDALQRRIDTLPAPELNRYAEGWGRVNTYTLLRGKDGRPTQAIVVGTLERTGERFVAVNIEDDSQGLEQCAELDLLGKRIWVRHHHGQNLFALSRAAFEAKVPLPSRELLPAYEHVLVERNGAVLEVTINRPQASNSLTPEANEELQHIFDVFEADASLWVAIITGAGDKAFCTGNDLKVGSSGRRMWMPKTGFGGLTHRGGRVKPVIAAVNGFAMGGGFEIALACDLVVADETAQFALSEVRVGLIAGAGGLQRLSRQVPQKQAMEMILTGRRVSAEDGQALGFVNRVTAPGQALQSARALAAEIVESSPTSIRYSKELLNEQARYASIDEAMLVAYPAIDRLLNSEDRIEGMTAFVQKRKPVWRNR